MVLTPSLPITFCNLTYISVKSIHLFTNPCCLVTAGSMLVLRLWGDKATVPNTALHFAFGIGM